MNAAVALLLAASLATDVSTVQKRYDSVEAKRLVPMLSEVLQFPTLAFQTEAHEAQKAWLLKTATDLGFVARDAGKITEIELPGPAGAPVVGLIVHGDVVAVDADAWSFPPFGGTSDEQFVYGRGSVDDKGPLVQALLAMKALEQSGVARTHTIRLLVGSEEESEAVEMKEYLATHAAPDYSLVLDAQFPVVAGEKAWNAVAVEAVLTDDGSKPYTVTELLAGLAPSIVPDRAEVKLKWKDPSPARWQDLEPKLRKVKLPEGTRLAMLATGAEFHIVTYGKSAHAGMNAEAGRNALVA
ncbi:MAG TPA: M20/M25/M40 family metallo-hydrolase, partial [Thermoanaerobaculia bacterium]